MIPSARTGASMAMMFGRSRRGWTELRQLIRDAPQSASNVAIQPVPVEAAQAVPWSVIGNGAAISASWRDSRVNQQAVRVA
jgi:hypothetical protein